MQQRVSIPTAFDKCHGFCVATNIQRRQFYLTPVHRSLSPLSLAALPPGLEEYVSAPSQSTCWASIRPNSEQTAVLGTISTPVLVAVAALLGYTAGVWPRRPRGWCRRDLIELRASPVQGRGIFARKPIAECTVVGAYPGRLRSAAEMALKCETAPTARYYCFRNKRNEFLDPTDWGGEPSATPAPGMPWLPVDPTLAFANEPPKGSTGVNVTVEDDPKDEAGLLFVTTRAVAQDCELFVDYGLDYDRSRYFTIDEPMKQEKDM